MSPELLTTILDAGIGVLAVVVISFLFWHSLKNNKEDRENHRLERKEWLESNEKRDNKITAALEHLASSVNNFDGNNRNN